MIVGNGKLMHRFRLHAFAENQNFAFTPAYSARPSVP